MGAESHSVGQEGTSAHNPVHGMRPGVAPYKASQSRTNARFRIARRGRFARHSHRVLCCRGCRLKVVDGEVRPLCKAAFLVHDA